MLAKRAGLLGSGNILTIVTFILLGVPVLAIVIHYFWKRRLIQQRIAAGELPPNFLAIPIRNRTLAWETWNLGGLPVKNHDPGPRPELHEICTGEESSLGEEAEYWSGLTPFMARLPPSAKVGSTMHSATLSPPLGGNRSNFPGLGRWRRHPYPPTSLSSNAAGIPAFIIDSSSDQEVWEGPSPSPHMVGVATLIAMPSPNRLGKAFPDDPLGLSALTIGYVNVSVSQSRNPS